MRTDKMVAKWVLLTASVGICLIVLHSAAQAAPISLTINSTQSNLTLGGVAFGLPYNAQAPGSNVSSLSGTINADLTAGVFTFSGGSTITVNLNPINPLSHAPWILAGETADSRPGNFGVQGSGLVFEIYQATIKGVYENMVFTLPSGTAQNGSPASANIQRTAGRLVWGAEIVDNPPAGGTSNVSGVSVPNTSTANVTWNGTTLTLPVKFLTTGSNREEHWEGTIVASIPAPPAPVFVNSRPYHGSFPGVVGYDANRVDTGVSLIQRGAAPQQAQLSNIISSSQGINGVVLDFDNLAALGDITLEYKMSPPNVFPDPVASWASVPPAPTASLLADAGQAGSDRVLLTWLNNAIENRYLCIKVIYNGNTIAELYLGHLKGEMDGLGSSTAFIVRTQDIAAVRNDLLQSKDASGRTDVDKNGIVRTQDIAQTRLNLTQGLTRVTIPANP